MSSTPPDIFIIDDDTALGEMLTLHFDDNGLHADWAGTAADALEKLGAQPPRLILLDQHLPDTLGLNLLPKLKEILPITPVLMITGKHDMELAIQAMRGGAADYIHKPIDTRELDGIVHRLLSQEKSIPATADNPLETGGIIGRSRAALEMVKAIALASRSDATVMLLGESGTGKELAANTIHHHAGKEGAFVAVNCAAIPESLLESELFGHEKGAFTGATERKEGKFTLAENGTLFLDEISEMPLRLQAKLLRVLQEHTFERVGGTHPLSTNARIITASNRNLEQMVRDGTFREDLFYRLNVVKITMPPLRERREDLPLLVPHLLNKIARGMGRPVPKISQDAWAKINAHNWPGNIRELENTLTRAMALSTSATLDAASIAPGATAPGAAGSTEKAEATLASLDEMAAQHIQRVLTATGGHKSNACKILRISRPALDRKIKKYGLKLPR